MTEAKEAKKKKNTIYNIIIGICVVVFLFAAYKLGTTLYTYYSENKFNEEVIEEYVEKTEEGVISYVDLPAIREKNTDVVGWIYIPGTKVNYPLLHGKSNKSYIKHNYLKNWQESGSIFIEAANSGDLSDAHTIIYGHRMKNGSMFGNLGKYTKESFRNSHPYVYILNTNMLWEKYEIYSEYTAEITDGTYSIFARSGKGYDEFVKLTMDKNEYSGTKAPEGEKLITLSTCTNNLDADKRITVHAKYIDTIAEIE